jgi:hypothetical protein
MAPDRGCELFFVKWPLFGCAVERGERIATVINFLIGIGMLDEFQNVVKIVRCLVCQLLSFKSNGQRAAFVVKTDQCLAS